MWGWVEDTTVWLIINAIQVFWFTSGILTATLVNVVIKWRLNGKRYQARATQKQAQLGGEPKKIEEEDLLGDRFLASGRIAPVPVSEELGSSHTDDGGGAEHPHEVPVGEAVSDVALA